VLPVLILRHDADAGPGYLGEALTQAGIEARVVDPAAEEILEGLDWAGIVSLGGLMGAYEESAYPWLRAEKGLLARAVAAEIPTLGICLGCQLLADALGGRAYPSGGRELGVVRVTLTPQGCADPVARHLEGPVVVSHADTWDLPPGACLLAASARYRQAFRLGSGLGLQPHPEVGPEAFARWVHDKPREALEAEGIDPEAAIEAVADHAGVQRAVAAALFGAWAAEVASR
jgi:GMP synthase (glutamine-hydrolysing)